MKFRVFVLIAAAQILFPTDAIPNPLPLSHVPPLEDAILEVIETQGRSGGFKLTRLLCRYGFSISEETSQRVHAHMPLLEPFILASQRKAGKLDGRLHTAFSRWASSAARDSMCGILRGRLPAPEAEEMDRTPNDWKLPEVRDLVTCAEILSDYRDIRAVNRITAARQILMSLDWEKPRRFHATESPAWFLDMALRRIRDPESAAILLPRDPDVGFFRVCRQASEILELRVTVDAGPEATWHRVSPNPERDRRILAHLASSRAAPQPMGGMYANFRWACLEIVFRGGLTATIDLTTLGVRYTDNSRYSATRQWLLCNELVKDVWELAGQFEDMIEIFTAP